MKDQRSLKRDYNTAAKSMVRWLANPVSAGGAAAIMRVTLALGGPDFPRIIAKVKKHPDGQRIFDDRPDLASALSDMDGLSRLPEGSFGKTYYHFMNKADVVPGYLLGGLIYRGGYFDNMDMDDETRWFLVRMMNTHDLGHVVSGYGADLAAEAVNIMFTLGHFGQLKPWMNGLNPMYLGMSLLRPTVGWVKWRSALREGFNRGYTASRHYPIAAAYWEELLPLPVEEVREMLGVPEKDVSGGNMESWLDVWPFTMIREGFGTKDKRKSEAKYAQEIIESGVPVADYMRADQSTIKKVHAMFDAGRDARELLNFLRSA